MDRNENWRIYGFFMFFIVLFILNFIIPLELIPGLSYTPRMWWIFILLVTTLSIFILVREKRPSMKIILIALILGVLVGLSNPIGGVCTIFCFIATIAIFKKYKDNEIPLLKKTSLRGISITFALGMIVGLILGAVNVLFMLGSGNEMVNNFTLQAFIFSLNPGIFEEVSFRFFMFAFCIYLINGKIRTKQQEAWIYIMMIVPHVLIHTPDQLFDNGLPYFIVSIILISFLFGLPLALLQRKHDLSSAIIAHALIDFIRFSLFGLPS